MRSGKNRLCAALAALAAGWGMARAEVIWSESFETDGSGTRYTAVSEFWDSANDYFVRTNGSTISTTTAPYGGVDGSWFWAAEDTDDTGAPAANGLKNQYLTLAPVSVAGYTDLEFTGRFGVGNEGMAYDDGDHAWLAYSLDGGSSWVKALQFNAMTENGITNQAFAANPAFSAFTNPADPADGNTAAGHSGGSGIGAPLSSVLSPFSVSLPDAESIMFMVNVSFDAANEEFAFDAFRVTGTASVPEPTTAVTFLTAMAGLALRRRRRHRG